MKEFDLEPGEHVVLETRKHWLLFVMDILPYAILAILPFALPKLLLLVPSLSSYTDAFRTPGVLMRTTLLLWLLFVWTMAWSSFTRYYLNAWILTNQRIVDIKQHSYFNRQVSSLTLSHVQDVTTNVTGVLSSLFNIGKITVQSAGAVDEFHMFGIPRPEQMRDVILKYTSAYEGKSDGL